MKKLRVAVLSGGTSGEREVSLSSGREVVTALEKTGRFNVLPIEIAKDGKWLLSPNKVKVIGKAKAKTKALVPVSGSDLSSSKIDVAFIAMHGVGGEDGTMQGLLELLGIAYTGSGVLASALGMDKSRSLKLFEQAGMRAPEFRVWKKAGGVKQLFGLQFPVVIKPNRHGSSIGISIVKKQEDLKKAVDLAFSYDNEIMIQDYIEGIELTVGIIGNERLEVLPVTEIIPNKGEFYDYASKYDPDGSKHITPARVDQEVAALAQEWAKTTHRILGCRGFSRTDFIYGTPANKISTDLASHEKNLYVLEINTIPGLTPTSLFPDAAKVAGYEFSELVEKLIHLALEGK